MDKLCKATAALGVLVVVAVGCGGSGSTSTSRTVTDPVGSAPASTELVPSTSTATGEAELADASILDDLASVPMSAIAAAYAANPSTNPVQVNADGAVRASAGKAEVLYIGAEFCPFCAAERWALNVALAKFGTLSDLSVITSSEGDVPTFSYVGSKFTSDQVAFKPIELQGQDHQSLESGTAAQMKLFQSLGGGSFPFIDFGGTAFQKGGSVNMQLLVGKSQADIAAELAASTAKETDPDSIPGNVNAVAGEFIRTICDQTNDQPAKVCNAIPARS